MNYLPVSVYSSDTGDVDFTNGGVTVTNKESLCVPCETGYLSEENVRERGYTVLELINPAFEGCPMRLAPRGETRWTMMGGNFVYTHDSRFSETYGDYPIAVHDRIEER